MSVTSSLFHSFLLLFLCLFTFSSVFRSLFCTQPGIYQKASPSETMSTHSYAHTLWHNACHTHIFYRNALDCFSLHQQINDLLILRTQRENRKSIELGPKNAQFSVLYQLQQHNRHPVNLSYLCLFSSFPLLNFALFVDLILEEFFPVLFCCSNRF